MPSRMKLRENAYASGMTIIASVLAVATVYLTDRFGANFTL